MSNALAEFSLPIDPEVFLKLFWLDATWYEKHFLIEKLNDLEVTVGRWHGTSNGSFRRSVTSLHPSQVSFPGLPSHAESSKIQTYELERREGEIKSIFITESDSLKGIPYSDYFTVHTEWRIFPKRPSSHGKSCVGCDVKIGLGFKFLKSTWLQSTIESNTHAELLRVYEIWLQTALEHIPTSVNPSMVIDDVSENASPHSRNAVEVQKDMEADLPNSVAPATISVVVDGSTSVVRLKSVRSDVDLELRELEQLSRRNSGNQYAAVHQLDDFDEDDEFYDCEEAYSAEHFKSIYLSTQLARKLPGSPPSELRTPNPTPPQSPLTINNFPVIATAENSSSRREMAVSIVEGSFVLAEFSFWMAYRFYTYDLKVLFNIRSSEVRQRIINSMIPGRHAGILKNPDFYGPILAVFTLPQVLHLSMQMTHHGCSQSSLLGNSVVVTMCVWVGLSCLYRALAYFVSPWMHMKHCLCITGYSLFSWSAALLLSYPLDSMPMLNSFHRIIPFLLFGLPTAIAQGYMFWEYTPASTYVLKPLSPHEHMTSPSVTVSYQSWCNKVGYKWLQRFLWAIPKIAVFLFIAGTHYQFLWYISHVILPGKKQLCALSTLAQPSRYADILTQKELLRYAAILLSKKKHAHGN